MKLGVALDANNIPILNQLLEGGTAFPANPQEGRKFYRTDQHTEYVYKGATLGWVAADVGSIPAASTGAPGVVQLATTVEATAGTDASKAVTAAGVKAVITALVNASPTTLDTLAELATALGNDPNFATTMMNLIATKAQVDHKHDLTGAADFTGILPINKGGTGSNTASGARAAIGAITREVQYNPALTAGTWATLTHGLGARVKSLTLTDVTTGDTLLIDWKVVEFNGTTAGTQVSIKADIAVAAGAYYVNMIG